MALLAPADPAPAKTELEFSIKQAREQLRLAELEHLPFRRRVHLTVAQHWIRLAERARRVQKGAGKERVANSRSREKHSRPLGGGPRSEAGRGPDPSAGSWGVRMSWVTLLSRRNAGQGTSATSP